MRKKQSEGESVCAREGTAVQPDQIAKGLIERAVLLISSFMENMTGRLITNKN